MKIKPSILVHLEELRDNEQTMCKIMRQGMIDHPDNFHFVKACIEAKERLDRLTAQIQLVTMAIDQYEEAQT